MKSILLAYGKAQRTPAMTDEEFQAFMREADEKQIYIALMTSNPSAQQGVDLVKRSYELRKK